MPKQKKWSISDDNKLIELVNKGLLWQHIAKQLECSPQVVQRRAKALNLGYKNKYIDNPVPFSFKIAYSTHIKMKNNLNGRTLSEYVRTLIEKDLEDK